MDRNKKTLLDKVKGVLSDSVWTIAALVMLNVVSQFLIYPVWAKVFDAEIYGDIIFVMSLVNTFAIATGVAVNYARMRASAKGQTANGDYNTLLLGLSVLVAVACFCGISISDVQMPFLERVLAAVLAMATMWRYYSDVEYRLSLNYKGYFVYYLVISIGYLIGLGLFLLTKIWVLALLPGELLGLFWVYRKGTLYRKKPLERSADFSDVWKVVALLVGNEIMSNAIFNGDRILLQFVMGGTAVTVYYLASLLGKTLSLITTPLNSVIIGYLARYKGEVTKKMLHIFVLITLAAIVLATGATVLGSHILIRILYPDNYHQVREYFLLANLAQIVYFVTNVVTTVLLRFAKANRQLIINGSYAAAFLAFCIPGTIFFGVPGFCVALLCASLVRYSVAVVCCYRTVGKGQLI